MSVKRIEHIDVWRFFAVMLVIQEHFLLFTGLDRYIPQIETYSLQIERFGELGVLIFFSISGFVICTALNSEKNTSGKICLSAFYTRRFFRIIPPLWFYLLVIFLLSKLGVITKISGQQFLTSITFLCNLPFEKGCSWFAGHTWSLAYEEQFYLLFPFLFLWAWRGAKSSRLSIAIVLLVSTAITLQQLNQIFWAEYAGYFLFLLSGCFTAFLPIRWMQKLRALQFSTWFLSVVIFMSLICFLPNKQDAYFKILVYPIFVQIMVFGTPTHFLMIKMIFENAIFSYFGRISYGIYLWQELATAYYENMPWWINSVYLVFVFIFAAISFRYFEIPCQKLGTAFSNQLKMKNNEGRL
ncbi:MAG: acyltransferase [Methylococcaceae bacterium]